MGGHESLSAADVARLDHIEARVRATMADRCLLPEGTRLVAAVSGGADSVLLARVLQRTGDRWPLVEVVFVDHGLRDVTLEREAAAATASALGTPFRVAKVTLPTTGNRQQEAREARYGVLEMRAKELGAKVATGHTLTDQAETVLARAVRGSGLRGLSGIGAHAGLRVRPLLDVERHEARAFSWGYVDDPSNETERYLRNRLRHQVLPLLERENPRAARALASLADAAAAEMALVDRLTDRMLGSLDRSRSLEGRPAFEVETLVRWRVARDLPGGVLPRANAVQLLVGALTEGADRRVSLGQGVAARSRRGVLAFEADPDPRRAVVAHGPGRWAVPAALVLVLEADSEATSHELLRGAGESDAPTGRLSHREVLWLDPTNITWPLTLRPWNLGDSVGSPGAWVLCDGAGKSLWNSGQQAPQGAAGRGSQNTLFTYLRVMGH